MVGLGFLQSPPELQLVCPHLVWHGLTQGSVTSVMGDSVGAAGSGPPPCRAWHRVSPLAPALQRGVCAGHPSSAVLSGHSPWQRGAQEGLGSSLSWGMVKEVFAALGKDRKHPGSGASRDASWHPCSCRVRNSLCLSLGSLGSAATITSVLTTNLFFSSHH